jgi:hypothetical protein
VAVSEARYPYTDRKQHREGGIEWYPYIQEATSRGREREVERGGGGLIDSTTKRHAAEPRIGPLRETFTRVPHS